MKTHVASVDVGGSSIKLGVVSDGQLLARASLPTEPALGLAAALPQIGVGLAKLAAPDGLDPDVFAGVGIGLPCIVDCRQGRVLSAPTAKYDDASTIDLPAWAHRALQLPGHIENDAHLALLGEWMYGAGRGVDNLVMVTLGTGVGTSVLIEGRPLRGRHYQAGLLGGFTVVSSGGRRGPESASGSVEAETGTWALTEIVRDSPAFAKSQLARQDVINYEILFRLAEQGDDLSQRLRDRSLDLWSDLVVNLIHLFDPQRVILGGAVMRRAGVVIPWVQQRVDRDAWTPGGRVEVVAAEFPEDAGLLGASVPFLRELSYL